MTLSEHRSLTYQQCYNEGWNSAAARWDIGSPKLMEPDTPYTGERRKAFIEGFRDSQDSLLLDRRIKP